MPVHVRQADLAPGIFLLALIEPGAERVRARHDILLADLLFDEGCAYIADGRIALVDGIFVGCEAREARCVIGVLCGQRDAVVKKS